MNHAHTPTSHCTGPDLSGSDLDHRNQLHAEEADRQRMVDIYAAQVGDDGQGKLDYKAGLRDAWRKEMKLV